jgi:dolichol-phosphate mannosyltransferase
MAGRRGKIVNPLLSVVMPVDADSDSIADIIGRILAVGLRIELVVVGLGLPLGRREEVLAQQRAYGFAFIDGLGADRRGAAIRRALDQITGDLVVVQGAHGDYPPEALPELTALICQGRADVVFGSRFIDRTGRHVRQRDIGGRVLTLVANMLYNARLTDVETGCTVMRTHLVHALRLERTGADVDAELKAKILKSGCRVYEVPIGSGAPRDHRTKAAPGRLAATRVLLSQRFSA